MLWQPTLGSGLLTLRPLAPADWDALFEAASDPLIWALHPEPTRFQRDVFRGFFDGALESRGGLTVLDATTGAVIGSSRYSNHRPDLRSVEIGYTFLTRAYWGGACNHDLKSLMLTYAFTLVDTVWFYVGKANLRSRAAMLKIGGRLRPNDEAPTVKDPSQHVVFRIDRASWTTASHA